MTEQEVAARLLIFGVLFTIIMAGCVTVAVAAFLTGGGDTRKPTATSERPWIDYDDQEPEILEGEIVEETTDVVAIGNIWGRWEPVKRGE